MELGSSDIKRSIVYGSNLINYRLLYCDRKTMEIAVHPDSSVIVKAPFESDISLIEKKINKRARWILRQIRYFNQFTPRTPKRCYVNGETHLYLGKQYRLKLKVGTENSVKLSHGFFLITSSNKPTPLTADKMLNEWYLEKAKFHFRDSMDRCWQKFSNFGFNKPKLSIKKMKKRWGSLSEKGIMTLNADLIKAPKECIDYVVTHELCHLKYHNHGPEFYKLLDSVIPDWKKIKHKLELRVV